MKWLVRIQISLNLGEGRLNFDGDDSVDYIISLIGQIVALNIFSLAALASIVPHNEYRDDQGYA